MTQSGRLSNVANADYHQATTAILNECSTPMANLRQRYEKIIPQVQSSLKKAGSASESLEIVRENIDNPESLLLLEAEVGAIEKIEDQQEKQTETKKFKELNRNGFVHKIVHKQMAEDVTKKTDKSEDVVVMIAGAPHIYGLNQELKQRFGGCKTITIGNFAEFQVDLQDISSIRDAQKKIGKESCQKVSEIIGFEVDEETKIAKIPDKVSEMISEVAKNKEKTQSLAEKFSAKKSDEIEKSWVERVRQDATKGTSKNGFKEL